MPPNDQEPRYRLVDANGNVVGSLFLNGNGDVAIQDESGTETAFTTDGISTPAVDTDSLSTAQIGTERYYAGNFSGSSPDTRLDNALSEASAGSMIYLEAEEYTADRSIVTRASFEGTGNDIVDSTRITGT